MDLKIFLHEVAHEVGKAQAKHEPLNSLHEAYAVILEEVDELWEHCRKKKEYRNSADVLNELIQIAAMAARAAYDLKV